MDPHSVARLAAPQQSNWLVPKRDAFLPFVI